MKYHYREEFFILGICLLTSIVSLIYSLIIYGVGYYGGDRLKRRFSNKEKFDNLFNKYKIFFCKHKRISLLILRLIPFSRTYVSLFAGLCEYEFIYYLVYSFIGIFIWNTILVLLGFSIYSIF